MEAFWKWLMHLNARRVCVVSVLVFLGMIGWRTWIEFRPRKQSKEPTESFTPRTFGQLGVLAFADAQLDPDKAIVPICPFRPPAEAMPTNRIIHGAMTVTVHNDPPINVTKEPTPGTIVEAPPPANEDPDEFDWDGDDEDPKRWQKRPVRPIKAYYRGRMQRPDGSTLAYMSDSRRKQSRFVGVNGRLFGAKVISVDRNKLVMQLPDGERRELAIDDYIIITPAGTPPANPGARRPAPPARKPAKKPE